MWLNNKMEEFDDFDFETNEEWDDKEREESPVFRFVKIIVALLVIIGLINIFGLRSLFFYRTTSPSVEQNEVEMKIDAEILQVPLNIIVLTTAEEGYGSKRNKESILSLVRNAGVIWEQGGIELTIKNIHFEEKSNTLISRLYQDPNLVINNVHNFDNESINVFLVGSLGGVNGVSFGGLNTVAVADYTTVYDFRALAHEVGHTLGLSHVSESTGQLMYQGANGSNLTIDEIEVARNNVKSYER